MDKVTDIFTEEEMDKHLVAFVAAQLAIYLKDGAKQGRFGWYLLTESELEKRIEEALVSKDHKNLFIYSCFLHAISEVDL